jgi:hypothetical protein
MRPLPKEFDGKGEVKGYTFTQVVKERFGYVYRVDGGSKTRYEVFKHKENERYGIVRYPRSQHFGRWAYWTFDFERAKEILLKRWKKKES